MNRTTATWTVNVIGRVTVYTHAKGGTVHTVPGTTYWSASLWTSDDELIEDTYSTARQAKAAIEELYS